MCGCNKNRGMTSARRGPTLPRLNAARSSAGNIIAPAQIRSLAVSPSSSQINETGTNAAKRKIQALRREAILKSKGK